MRDPHYRYKTMGADTMVRQRFSFVLYVSRTMHSTFARFAGLVVAGGSLAHAFDITLNTNVSTVCCIALTRY